MNLVKILDTLDIDASITESPAYFLLFKELFLEKYAPMYSGGYIQIFNKEILNKYFEGEISYNEILQATDMSVLQLDHRDEFLPLIKFRLEEIRELPEPAFNEEKMVVLKAFVDSPNAFVSLPYIMKSIHKHELITLLALTDWDVFFTSTFGWGVAYTATTFDFHNIFEIGELEVYLPYEETKKLIDNLPERQYENLYSDLEASNKAHVEDKEILTRLSSLK